MKVGFLEGCRPLIGLDGCFLKGPFGGCLLSAVTLDGNKRVFPLAFAIVQNECIATWTFFLDCLRQCIGPECDSKPWTFISDRQKGLIEAVRTQFEGSIHRYCCQHLLMNFKKRFPGVMLRKEFWMAVKSSHSYAFKQHMKNVEAKNEGRAAKWLLDIPISHWSRHFQTLGVDMLSSSS
ncbi:uncharacterized protein LOC105632432 [Jatropha curcas]|uniref:uncharacterized protein LOC105632432 n=1 Tax=Jatropha curcas TaxID=180498 RepID=UPI0018945FEB|nr:uncharacterized protein LOC105632432 [Jatropha curcas]